MTYVKRAKSGGVEITSAALTLSGLEEQEFLEVQTLNGAVVLFSADAERHELAGIVNELVRLAEAIITDVLDEEEAEQELDTVPFPKAILENAGLNGNEYHVFSDKGIVMIVDKNQDFSLSPETRECLHEHVVFPAVDMILAIFFFVKLGTAYFDYRKSGQFEWTAPAILFACLVFTLTAPTYIWTIIGI